MQSIPLDQPADLGALEAFLTSDQVSENCMTLSELDGFLAGILASPELIPPSEWLPHVWGDDGPAFNDLDQANAVFGHIMRRYNEMTAQLGAVPPTYRPILVTTEDGKVDGSDWAYGFVSAMALRQEGWAPLASDERAGMLLTPIVLVASTTRKANLPLEEDEMLPPEEMAKLLAEPGELLGMCATGIRLFFRQSDGQMPPRPRRPARKQRAAGKRRRTH